MSEENDNNLHSLIGLQVPSPCGWVWICNKITDGWVHLVSGDLRHVNKMTVERFLALREQMKEVR